jgi:hypothetical protein
MGLKCLMPEMPPLGSPGAPRHLPDICRTARSVFFTRSGLSPWLESDSPLGDTQRQLVEFSVASEELTAWCSAS